MELSSDILQLLFDNLEQTCVNGFHRNQIIEPDNFKKTLELYGIETESEEIVCSFKAKKCDLEQYLGEQIRMLSNQEYTMTYFNQKFNFKDEDLISIFIMNMQDCYYVIVDL